ncbi:MDR/zinc-dependent alcohol dehydrogenase-like family protein [Peristeroidobacter agariperforans]|uniref:MDR/zinc-dependent alcohol dehydrogenase-like family protein n=1 Tax=Peristeroidobacter agariperforans TaxID=268404 RepID=UPI001E4073E1|nr:zinc-binding dehydrogenase [Peristeroidobacter agariperforans]
MTTRISEVRVPEPGANEVRVMLEGCGICASNLPVWEGREWFKYPLEAGSPGHEGWGIVDAVGAGVEDLEAGQRVALMSGHAYAEYDIASRNCVVALPEELDDEPFPGEPFGCVMNIFERSDIHAGQTVAVVGGGFIGLLLTQLASDAGAHVVVLSHREWALQLALTMEAEDIIATKDDGHDAERAMQLTSNRGFDRVIEVSGVQSGLDLASDIAGERARLIIAGYHQDGPRQVNMQQWNWRGLDVINAHERSMDRYVLGVQKAIQAALEGRLDPFPLLTHTVSLGSLDLGFKLMRERPDGFVKALLLNEVDS